VRPFADVLANEAVANLDGDDIDSNPVGLARVHGGYEVADAGGNAVVLRPAGMPMSLRVRSLPSPK
jgi:hypothetical protein